MRVARSLQEAAEFGPTAVTIGNFDGVHAGHRQLLRGVIEAAREKAVGAAVLTFDPHPVTVVAPERGSKLLTRHSERCAWMAREGIEMSEIGAKMSGHRPLRPAISHTTPTTSSDNSPRTVDEAQSVRQDFDRLVWGTKKPEQHTAV